MDINVKLIINKNRNIINNIIGAFCVKGASIVVGLLTMPAYIRYFNNQKVLGIWFTIIAILNWVLMFDLGLGSGLRNKLPAELQKDNYGQARKYITSTYGMTIIFVILVGLMGETVIPYINWNSILGVDLISREILSESIRIVFLGIMFQFILKIITSILFAIQKSAVVNLLTLISNVIILLGVCLVPSRSLEENLLTISWVNLFAVNFPLFITTIILFFTKLRDIKPNIKYFDIKCGQKILQIGIALLWLQVIFMVISSTNELLITMLTSSQYVVEYQAYNRVFNCASSVIALSLTPIWSAVTKAQSEKRYEWIKKLYGLLLIISTVVVLLEFLIVPFLQILMDLWLGKGIITVSKIYAVIFIISNGIFVINHVNTTICNGLSYFKIQIIGITFAALVDIPLAYLAVKITGSWIGIIIANIIALLPYEIFQPICFKKYIRIFSENKVNN